MHSYGTLCIRFSAVFQTKLLHRTLLHCAYQIPDQDLEVRRTEQRVDPISNRILVYSAYSPESKKANREEQDDNEEVEASQDTPETDDTNFFTEDLV